MTPLLPLDSNIISSLLTHFQRAAVITTLLVGLLFMARLSMLVISISGPSAFGELVKDTALYFVLIGLFPSLFKLTNEIIGAFAFRLYWEPVQHEPGVFDALLTAFKAFSPTIDLTLTLSPLIMSHLAQALSTLFVAMLVAIGPVVILLNTMLDFNKGVTIYFTAILSFCLWPVLWNLLGALSNELWSSFDATSMLKLIFWVCVMVLQFVSPFICIYLFTSLAPGKAVSKVVTKALAAKLPIK